MTQVNDFTSHGRFDWLRERCERIAPCIRQGFERDRFLDEEQPLMSQQAFDARNCFAGLQSQLGFKRRGSFYSSTTSGSFSLKNPCLRSTFGDSIAVMDIRSDVWSATIIST